MISCTTVYTIKIHVNYMKFQTQTFNNYSWKNSFKKYLLISRQEIYNNLNIKRNWNVFKTKNRINFAKRFLKMDFQIVLNTRMKTDVLGTKIRVCTPPNMVGQIVLNTRMKTDVHGTNIHPRMLLQTVDWVVLYVDGPL